MHLMDTNETLIPPVLESLDPSQPPWSTHPFFTPPERFLVVTESQDRSTQGANALVSRLVLENGGSNAYSIFTAAAASLLAYLLQHDSIERPAIQGVPQVQFANDTVYRWVESLKDWPTFLKEHLDKYNNAVEKESISGLSGASGANLRAGVDALQMANSLSAFKGSNQKVKVSKNFFEAAFALRLVYQGWNMPAPWPDFSEKETEVGKQTQLEKLNRYVEKITGRREACLATEEFHASLKALKDAGYECPRATLRGLQVSLAISPFLLWAGRSYTGRSVSTEKLPLIWVRLGGYRPPLLLKLEKMIWKSLLNIALSEVNILDVLGELAHELLQELGNPGVIRDSDRTFFSAALSVVQKPDSTAPDSLRPEASTHLQRDVGAGLPAQPAPPLLPEPTLHPPATHRQANSVPNSTFQPPSLLTETQTSASVTHSCESPVPPCAGEESSGTNGGSHRLAAATAGGSQHEVDENTHRNDDEDGEETEEDQVESGPRLRNKRGPPSTRAELPIQKCSKTTHPSSPSSRSTRFSTTAPSCRVLRDRIKVTPAQPAPAALSSRLHKKRKQQVNSARVSERTVNEKITILQLEGVSPEPRFVGKPQKFYDTSGKTVQITPSFHSKEDLNFFEAMVTGIGAKKKPQYLHDGGIGQLIQRVTYNQLMELREKGEEGDILRTRAILVNDVPRPKGNDSFDESLEGLNMSMDAEICCHDQSVPLGETGGERHRRSTLKTISDLSKKNGCKSINCLDFPGPVSSQIPLVHHETLDRLCFAASWDMHEPRVCLDTSAMEWSIAATAWAYHDIHMDTHGFGTTAVPLYGRKLWVLIRHKDLNNSRPFPWTDSLQDHNPLLTSGDFVVEYALLEPGNALIMPGGCPHMVFTLDKPTVFAGNHFYHGKSIQQHMIGLLHSAALPNSTNAEHIDCCVSILIRIAKVLLTAVSNPAAMPRSLRHQIRDVRTTDGIKDLLVVVSVIRILPVLFEGGPKGDLLKASQLAKDIVEKITDSPSFQFWKAAGGQKLNFSRDIYRPYLACVCRVYCSLKEDPSKAKDSEAEDPSEAEGALRSLALQFWPEGASDGDSSNSLDLNVEQVAPFHLEYATSSK